MAPDFFIRGFFDGQQLVQCCSSSIGLELLTASRRVSTRLMM
jgi:hypothetical protein